MTYYKLFKVLFEKDEYESVSYLVKIAYGIFVSMLEESAVQNIDENGNAYIDDGRAVLKDVLNISTTTLTKIHEELVNADLIEEKWQGFCKSYRTYIKNYETVNLEKTKASKDYAENETKEIIKMFHCPEFSDFDVQDAKELIEETIGEFPYINVSRILKDLDLDYDFYSEKDMKMIKYAIAYMDYYCQEIDYECIIQYINLDIIDKALVMAVKDENCKEKVAVFGKFIFELAKKMYNEQELAEC